MPDINTTFGFVFSAEDQSTPAVERAQAAVDSAADGLENSLTSFTESTESIVGMLGPAVDEVVDHVESGVDRLTNSLSSLDEEVVPALGPEGFDPDDSGLLNVLQEAEDILDALRESEADEMAEAFSDLARGFEDFADNLLDDAVLNGLESFQDAIDAIPDDIAEVNENLETLGDTGPSIAHQLGASFGQVQNVLQSVTQLGGSMMSGGGAGGRIGGAILKSFGNMFGGGGILGYILGPVGPILQLLMPLVNLLADVLMPIFQDFLAIIQNAFAPLQFVLDTLLQSLIPDIQRLLGPIVAMLTHIAVELGTKLQEAFSGLAGMAGPIIQGIVDMMPALGKVVEGIVNFAVAAMPTFIQLLGEIVPVLAEVANIMADAFLARMNAFADVIKEIGPDLAILVGDLLKASLPLLKALTELSTMLLTEVFIPLALPFLKMVIAGLQVIIPLLAKVVEFFAAPLQDAADAVANLHENWEKFLVAFPEVEAFLVGTKELFLDFIDFIAEGLVFLYDSFMHFWSGSGIKDDVIDVMLDYIPDKLGRLWTWVRDTIQDGLDFVASLPQRIFTTLLSIGKWVVNKWMEAHRWLVGLGVEILDAMGLEGAADTVKGVFQSMLTSLRAPLERIREFVNYMVIGSVNEVLSAQLPVIGYSLGDVTSALYGYSSLPELAEGGIATGEEGQVAEIGEAGTAEAVVPLDDRGVQRFLEPAIGELSMEGMEEQTDLLSDLVELGKAALRLMEGEANARERREAEQGGLFAHDVDSDLDGTVGLAGLLPAGG